MKALGTAVELLDGSAVVQLDLQNYAYTSHESGLNVVSFKSGASELHRH